MSGHSKWANIQHRKGRQDAKRSNMWTKIVREIIIAARAGGGGDPDMNPKLRLALVKARGANVPKDTIKNAILKLSLIHIYHHHHSHSSLADVLLIIDKLRVPEGVRKDAAAVYQRIAEAEASAHGAAPGEIHFHEVGMKDAISDKMCIRDRRWRL